MNNATATADAGGEPVNGDAASPAGERKTFAK